MWIYVVLLVAAGLVATVAEGPAFWVVFVVGLYLGVKLVVMVFDGDPRIPTRLR